MYFFNMRVMKVIQTVYYKPYVIYHLKELLCFSIYYYTTHLSFCQALFGNLLKIFFYGQILKGGIKPLHTRRWNLHGVAIKDCYTPEDGNLFPIG